MVIGSMGWCSGKVKYKQKCWKCRETFYSINEMLNKKIEPICKECEDDIKEKKFINQERKNSRDS
jgi:hypothetical protein